MNNLFTIFAAGFVQNIVSDLIWNILLYGTIGFVLWIGKKIFQKFREKKDSNTEKSNVDEKDIDKKLNNAHKDIAKKPISSVDNGNDSIRPPQDVSKKITPDKIFTYMLGFTIGFVVVSFVAFIAWLASKSVAVTVVLGAITAVIIIFIIRSKNRKIILFNLFMFYIMLAAALVVGSIVAVISNSPQFGIITGVILLPILLIAYYHAMHKDSGGSGWQDVIASCAAWWDKFKRSDYKMSMLIVGGVFLFIGIEWIIIDLGRDRYGECAEKGLVYSEQTGGCREKTTDEQFKEQCANGITIGETNFSCSYIEDAELKEAYLKNNLIKHGNDLYVKGTYAEVQAGKVAGDYCLSAEDTWYHLGETRCVVLQPSYYFRQGYNFFINEKKEYKTGFTIYMYGNYDWNWFVDTFADKGPILSCGKITMYDGHPQIRTDPSGLMVSPNQTDDGGYTVYRYTCSEN